MFEEEDNENDVFEEEFYNWFNRYEFSFPKDMVYGCENVIHDFYNTKYTPIMRELVPEMRNLMYRHYPELETEFRPKIAEIIEQRFNYICNSALIKVFVLFYYDQNGFNLKEKFPELDEWARLYSTPIVPYKNMEETFEKLNLTREQIRGLVAELEKDDDFVTRKARRRAEFIHVIEKVVFKYLPLVDRLNSDGWIVFSAFMHQEFFEYKYHLDYLGTFVAFKLPEEDINLTYGELQKKFDAIYNEKTSGTSGI